MEKKKVNPFGHGFCESHIILFSKNLYFKMFMMCQHSLFLGKK